MLKKRSHFGSTYHHKHGWKFYQGLQKIIQWCHLYKCWNFFNSDFSLSPSPRPPPDMKSGHKHVMCRRLGLLKPRVQLATNRSLDCCADKNHNKVITFNAEGNINECAKVYAIYPVVVETLHSNPQFSWWSKSLSITKICWINPLGTTNVQLQSKSLLTY